MKEQIKSVVLPSLPIVGKLRLESRDGKSICNMTVDSGPATKHLDPFFQDCYEKLHDFLTGKSSSIKIKLDYNGLSEFQVAVLKAMKTIPYGKTATYKDLASKMNSRAYQAIGSACGRNPFMLIYPCHRVLGSNGIGGFAHGLVMKKQLLALEGTV